MKKSTSPVLLPVSHYENLGYLDVADQPKFRTIVDACNLLGQDYHGAQRAWYESKKYPDHFLWFPKFDENEDWGNRRSADGMTIFDVCKDSSKRQEWFDKTMGQTGKRICFPSRVDHMSSRYYQFLGIFETDFENASPTKGFQHKLIAIRFDL